MSEPQRPLPMGVIRAMDEARWQLSDVVNNGIRQSHGIGPSQPMTPAMRRDAATILRAIERLLVADRQHR